MISEDKNSLESKVVLAIKTVFEDLTKRMVNSTLETDFSRQTTSLHYIFKKMVVMKSLILLVDLGMMIFMNIIPLNLIMMILIFQLKFVTICICSLLIN